MKNCVFFLTLLFVLVFSNSCSNDVEVLAPYEENASIYALLDANASVQFIKINKVFTNPNSRAVDVAKIADSIFFDTLTPILIEEQTNKIIPLFRTNILLKDSGFFANSPNNLYSTNVQIFPNYTYKLELKLPKSNKLITAKTNIVNLSPIIAPQVIAPTTIDFSIDKRFPIWVNAGNNGKVFDVIFYFNYMEVNKADTTLKVIKSLPWKIIDKYRVTSETGNERIQNNLDANKFYEYITDRLPIDASIERRFLPCNFALFAGNKELDNYIQASEPSIGIVQKQTDYSNITNGIGLFASRNVQNYTISLNFNTKNNFVTLSRFQKLEFTLK